MTTVDRWQDDLDPDLVPAVTEYQSTEVPEYWSTGVPEPRRVTSQMVCGGGGGQGEDWEWYVAEDGRDK